MIFTRRRHIPGLHDMNINALTNIRTNFILIFALMMMAYATGCKKKNSATEERPRPGQSLDSLVLLPDDAQASEAHIDPAVSYQVMDNFGASDCWGVQYAGKWPEAKTAAMADWLFSMDTTANGQPMGIGLSAWRFNIGAGSSSQGSESGIEDEWRRAECFLLPNGDYDWNAQAGQQWFLKAAAERGVKQFIGFSNSPPVHMTKNGRAYGNPSDPENLSVNNIDNYATFLVEVIKGVKSMTGVEFTYLSPVNEPQWDWTGGGQEGCFMTNNTFLGLVEALDAQLKESPSLNTRILVTEAGSWKYLYGEGPSTGDQIIRFFGPESPVAEAPSLAKVIAGHSYYTTTPSQSLKGVREKVWEAASSIGNLAVWSTEYCPLGEGDLQALGWSEWKKDLGMDVALYVARIIHFDLTIANASAWHWWLALTPYTYPDGLIYMSKSLGNGTYSDSRLMWALGNYSRFVRPGAVRVEAEIDDDDLLISAFRDEVNQAFTIVVVNSSLEDKPLRLVLEGFEKPLARPYITSTRDQHKLMPMQPVDLTRAFEMPGQSIITFRLKHI